jgi:hypothetical protein
MNTTLVQILVQNIATFSMSTKRKHYFEIKQKSNDAQPTNTTGNITTGQPLFLPISGKEVAKN